MESSHMSSMLPKSMLDMLSTTMELLVEAKYTQSRHPNTITA